MQLEASEAIVVAARVVGGAVDVILARVAATKRVSSISWFRIDAQYLFPEHAWIGISNLGHDVSFNFYVSGLINIGCARAHGRASASGARMFAAFAIVSAFRVLSDCRAIPVSLRFAPARS